MAREPPNLFGLVKQNYFTISIFLCIILAEFAPWLGARGGPLVPEITVKYFAVFIIFYSSGLSIKWKDLSQAIRQFKIHVFIQVFSFVCIPIVIQFLVFLFGFVFDLNSWIRKGLVIVGCMPPPVSSAVILTKSIGGNESAAIFNSALGSILGIVLTPLSLLIHVGISSALPVLRTVLQLTQTMILPVILGLLSQRLFHQETLSRIPFSVFGQISLLFIIYTSFCDMFLQEDFSIDAFLVLVTILLVVTIQLILMLSTFQISHFLGRKRKTYTAQDVVAITFCSTHKSLTMGMPLLKTLYSGYSHLSLISLPLLIYHPVQLILGGFLVPYGRKWIRKNMKDSSSYKRP